MATPLPDSLKRAAEARHLVLALLALLALAGASWGLAHTPLGVFAAPAALLIALIKALLVAAVFMRLSHGTTAARFALGIALGFIILLTLLVASDVLLR